MRNHRNINRVGALLVIVLFLVCVIWPQPAQCAGDQFQEGISLLKARKYDEAVDALSRDISEAYNNRGYAWHLKGDYKRAIADYTRALDITPTYADAYNNRGLALFQTGEYDRAMSDYSKAIEINPLLAEAYYNRGGSWMNKEQYDQAVADYSKALEINPQFGEAYYNRGMAWYKKCEYDSAIADCSKALDINTNYADAYNQLAWILAVCPDERYRNGMKALEFAKKAVEIHREAAFFDTMAAAYAEVGSFKDAAETQEQALAMLTKTNNKAYLSQYQTRLASYNSRRPWRDIPMKGEEKIQYAAISDDQEDGPQKNSGTQKREVGSSQIPDSTSSKVFSVQVGAFLSSRNAEKLIILLKDKGYATRLFIMPDSRGKVWHYVLIGKYSTRDTAAQAAKAFSDREKMASTVLELEPF